MVGRWIAWRTEKGNKIRVGEDTWVGCSENLRLSDPILADLYALGIYKIKDAAGLGLADGWIQQ